MRRVVPLGEGPGAHQREGRALRSRVCWGVAARAPPFSETLLGACGGWGSLCVPHNMCFFVFN